ncbi:hypothetical protein PRZ48_002273 [Zasmidium cellare]|uniref:Heterokaryon incompatibility domain-containing protein n=1 Tax=Zasmidium cellare TaxID=395010 RepID=A0ABR0F3K5_ZASCE|nr:hypothetical protein PRZ48_002273 [Zasmidium cellare]
MKNLPDETHPAGLHYHDLEEHQFRVVNIHPANPNEILDIQLMRTSFYGLEDEKVQALCAGLVSVEAVPRTLQRFARPFELPAHWLRIDQLCINQDDDNDKAQQIPLIRSIFERAASTIVWLGDEGIEDCALAFDLIKKWYELTSGRDDAQIEMMPFEELLGPPTDGNLRSFRALRALMKLDYWDRTWVIRRTECSDHRDKVFSVLPFAADVGDYVNDRFLKPDYQRPAFEVYVDVARWHICTKQNLDILGYCTMPMDTDPFFLPSWIPNWTTSSFLQPLPKVLDWTVPSDEQHPMYTACGRFSHTSQLVFPPLQDWSTNQLFLSGLYIGTVHRVLEPVSALFLSLDMERSWQERLDPSAPYCLTGESMLTAFQRTHMVDREPIDGRPTSRDKFRRGADLTGWPDPSNATDYMSRAGFIKQMTRHRKLFFVDSRPIDSKDRIPEPDLTATAEQSHPQAADPNKLIMCLGREDVRVGDQLWALKGGSVLYVLHHRGEVVKMNDANSQGNHPDNANMPDQLWFNGAKREWKAPLHSKTYHFVGEAYAHGLMDGEALEYASKSVEERPEVLKDMAGEFQELLLGMGAMSLEDEEKKVDERGWSTSTYRIEEGEDGNGEVPAGKKKVTARRSLDSTGDADQGGTAASLAKLKKMRARLLQSSNATITALSLPMPESSPAMDDFNSSDVDFETSAPKLNIKAGRASIDRLTEDAADDCLASKKTVKQLFYVPVDKPFTADQLIRFLHSILDMYLDSTDRGGGEGAAPASLARLENVRATVTVQYTKGMKNRHEYSPVKYLSLVVDPSCDHVCPFCLLLAHALRHGMVEGGQTLQQVLDHAAQRPDHKIVWQYPNRPLARVRGRNTTLQPDKTSCFPP